MSRQLQVRDLIETSEDRESYGLTTCLNASAVYCTSHICRRIMLGYKMIFILDADNSPAETDVVFTCNADCE